ncbi:hypothetical protein HZ326_23671 [Fusarium oxysporum f. sp. albedinis]|nr:hypothetical protein HZ326_23671 [Fusarium oxysporum f. sp. albedinis]
MANRLLADRDASPVDKRWAINFVKRQPDLKTPQRGVESQNQSSLGTGNGLQSFRRLMPRAKRPRRSSYRQLVPRKQPPGRLGYFDES